MEEHGSGLSYVERVRLLNGVKQFLVNLNLSKVGEVAEESLFENDLGVEKHQRRQNSSIQKAVPVVERGLPSQEPLFFAGDVLDADP